MSNMSNALNMRYEVVERNLKGKSREELLKIRSEAEEREIERIENMIDWDYCFATSSVDRATINTCNELLEIRTKRDFTNTNIDIEVNNIIFNVTILEADKQHYNIINKANKLDVNYYGCGYGKVTGKGARKFMDDLEEVNKQVKKYINKNRYM